MSEKEVIEVCVKNAALADWFEGKRAVRKEGRVEVHRGEVDFIEKKAGFETRLANPLNSLLREFEGKKVRITIVVEEI